jgi:superfamily II DNA or RNA helicase
MAIITYSEKSKQTSGNLSKIILSNRLYVPHTMITPEILKAFTYQVGERKKDCSCSDIRTCPYCNVEVLHMFKRFKDGDYYGFGRGNIGKLKKLFDWSLVQDVRAKPKMKYPIEFTGKLWANQQKTADEWLKKQYGIIKSPPRSGKTVIFAYIACKLQYKTLVMVHQDELAVQFYNTFMNINKDGVVFTNAPELEKQYKTKIVGIAESLMDLEKDWSITIMTYQKFIRHLPQLKEMKNYWGMAFCDECQNSSAPVWSKIMQLLNAKIRWGNSATPKRKDGHHIIADNILGPVTSMGVSDQMKCEVEFLITPHKVENFIKWTTLINRMVKDDDRNQFIVESIAKDADAGRHILATTTRVLHAKTIARLLDTMGYSVEAIVGNTFGRKDIFDNFKTGKVQILIASRQITQVGLDIPILNCQHILVPNMNQYNLLQEISRCRTRYEGKPNPQLRFYIDRGHEVVHAIKASYDKICVQEDFYLKEDKIMQEKKAKGWGYDFGTAE